MSDERNSTVIDGDRYEMTLFGATQGYRLFHRLFKMFGPSFGHLVDAMSGDKGASIRDVNLASDAAVSALKRLVDDVHEADLDHLIDALRKQTHVAAGGGQNSIPLAGVFEVHFQGRMGTMFKWLAWGLRVQYASFFDALPRMKPPEKAAASSAGSNLNH